MTGTSPVLDRPALWAALSHMPIQLPAGAGRFEKALAERQGWTTAFAERVTGEYRRFLYLAATAGFEVTPSRTVDEAWHLHLTLPHYRDRLCERIVGRPLEHRPATGEPEDEERCRLQYEETLALYERVFGKRAPTDIWPHPLAEREHGDRKPGWGRGLSLIDRLALASLAGCVVSFVLEAPVIGVALAGVALILYSLTNPSPAFAAHSGPSAGCGGMCGGGSSRSGDDCGSTFGGASCGGGGCGGD